MNSQFSRHVKLTVRFSFMQTVALTPLDTESAFSTLEESASTLVLYYEG